jgi:predicted nucleic acid-binding protein
LIYLDTSAFLKTVLAEPQSGALNSYFGTFGSPRFVSSALLAVEARRSVLRVEPSGLPRTDLALVDVIQIGMTAAVLEKAGRLPDPMLRTLDAIHVATALLIREDVDVIVSYDHRMLAAAAAHGLPIAAPA